MLNFVSNKKININFSKKKNSNFVLYFILLSFFGIVLRIAVSKFGYSFDYVAWEENLNLFKNGESFYKHGKYNYSPVWVCILYLLDSISLPFVDNISAFRLKIIIFLSLVDVLIFFLLCRKYSLKIGLLFFLNPISIVITGLHNQFDTFAILAGFIAVLSYQKLHKNNYGFVISLMLFGFSLCIKHVLFLFPIWLAIKEKKLIKKILIILIPVGIFLLSFLPYLSNDFEHIQKHVFNFVSFNNGPFWGMFASKVVDMYIHRKLMFIIALLILGLFFEKKSIINSFYYYLISVVTFSSAITMHYLVIPVLAIAIFWNWKYFVYTILVFAYFLVNPVWHYPGEINLEGLREFLGWTRIASKIAIYPIILFLLLGFVETIFGKKKFNYFVLKIVNWFVKKIKSQITFS